MEKKSTSGLAVTALVLGIIALISSFVPLLNILSFPFVLLAIVFGGVGLWATAKGKKGGKGLAIAGLVLGALALLVTIAMYGGAASSADSSTTASSSGSAAVEQPASDAAADAQADTNAQAGADAATEQEAADAAAAEQEAAADSPYEVVIGEAEMGTDYQGEKAIVVEYTFTNNSDEARNFMTVISAQAFQDGVELESAIGVDGVDSQDLMKDLKPGKSITLKQAYVLADTKNEVTVEVSELWDFNNELIAEKAFSL